MNEHVPQKKRIHVFMNGRSRAVRIPKEFDFEGNLMEVTQLANGVLMYEPVLTQKPKSWAEVFAGMTPLGPEDQFPDIDDSDMLPLRDIEL